MYTHYIDIFFVYSVLGVNIHFFWTRLTKTEHAFDAGDLGELPKLVIKHSQFWWDLNGDLNGDLMKSGGIVLMVLWDLMG